MCYDEHKTNLAVKDIISHIYKDATGQWKIQTNAEHSNNVAKLARSFADELGMGMWGYVLGMLHDKGKESDAFQSYIRKESGFTPEAKCSLEHNHAFVGVQFRQWATQHLSEYLVKGFTMDNERLKNTDGRPEIAGGFAKSN